MGERSREGRNSLMYVLGFQNTAGLVHRRAKLTEGHPGDAFSEFQREKHGVMVHIIPANQWTLKQKSVFKLVLALEYRKD